MIQWLAEHDAGYFFVCKELSKNSSSWNKGKNRNFLKVVILLILLLPYLCQ